MEPLVKPLGRKSYGRIGHLPGSRLGPGDNHVHPGQAAVMTERCTKLDRIIVQEKLDGSNVGVCLVGGEVVAIGRAGWPAWSSKYEQHHLFAVWVRANEDRFRAVLREGERVCGEWLALMHGTRYELRHEPFVAFDLFDKDDYRMCHDEFVEHVVTRGNFVTPHVYHNAAEAYPLKDVWALPSRHGADGLLKEGVVYRWERAQEGPASPRVVMLAKWVRPGKEDRVPEDGKEHWHWRPGKSAEPAPMEQA